MPEQKQGIREALASNNLAISNVNAFMMHAVNDPRQKYWHPSWIEPDANYRQIRIDIINSLLSKRVRNWIDVIGHWFFIVPICLVMLYTGVPFFYRSLMQNEQSTNAGGLPVYPAKFLVPLAFLLLLAQGISELIKRRAIMKGMLEDTSTGGGHLAAAEAEAERLVATLAEAADRHAAATKVAASAAART